MRDIYCSSTCPAVIRNTLPAGFHPALPSPGPDQPRVCFVQPRQKPPRTGCAWRSRARFGTGRTRLRSTQENCQIFSRNCRFSPREQKQGAFWAALGVVSGRGLGEKLSWHQCAWRSMRGGKGCGAASREGSDGCSFRGCAGGRKGKHAVRTSNGYIFFIICAIIYFLNRKKNHLG